MRCSPERTQTVQLGGVVLRTLAGFAVSGYGWTQRIWPGLLLAGVLAAAASFIASRYGGPVMLYALLLGMSCNFLSHGRAAAGFDFSTQAILKIGVALLGARITLGDFAALGGPTFLLVASAVPATVLVGWGIGRLFRLEHDHALLAACGVAICGASAALAVAAVLPPRAERDSNVVLTVAGLTALSTLVMFAYPVLTQAVGFDSRDTAVFLGATIHDVAQVVAASLSVSDSVAESATTVKLLRVAMLVPVVAVLSLLYRKHGSSPGKAGRLPPFLIAFLLLVLLNSLGSIPEVAVSMMRETSSAFILAAVAALGVKTSLTAITRLGARPIAALAVQTAFLAIFIGSGLLLIQAISDWG